MQYGSCADAGADVADREEGDAGARSVAYSSMCYNSFAASGLDTLPAYTSSSHETSSEHSSLARAVFHIFKGNVGAGVFLLPTYYKDTGYVLGVLCVVVLGLVMIDCTTALLHVVTTLDVHHDARTYPAVVGAVLGKGPQLFTEYALVFTQFGFCVIYLQYASSLFAELLPRVPYAYAIVVLLSVVLVTPMTFFSSRLALLAVASVVAGVCVAVVLAATTAEETGSLYVRGRGPGVQAVTPTARVLVFVAGHMFSLEGIGVVLPVNNSIHPRQRGRFVAVLRYTLLFIVVLYACFGVLGYLSYGDTLSTSVVLALPEGATKRVLQCMLGVSLLLGYPIQYVPAIQLVDKALSVSTANDNGKGYAVRVALNALFGVVAVCIGDDTINLVASFLGAFAGVHLMMTIPTLLAMKQHALTLTRRSSGDAVYDAPHVTAAHARWRWYVVFAVVVWLGGMYYTVASLRSAPRDAVSAT